ncbi:hypothetical protein PTT_09843 [Pyrenophora teres f. teres 0-1]|uniref:Uncharacterized protein n=1 Tax=Pyrenophora teres f. teres (strain 0-1) TaxID=861557 RepID=E3RMV6_PYRTT|nr:hypothetical protein PTT_09843 [Pyrenophora teres f. teres 0-1]
MNRIFMNASWVIQNVVISDEDDNQKNAPRYVLRVLTPIVSDPNTRSGKLHSRSSLFPKPIAITKR